MQADLPVVPAIPLPPVEKCKTLDCDAFCTADLCGEALLRFRVARALICSLTQALPRRGKPYVVFSNGNVGKETKRRRPKSEAASWMSEASDLALSKTENVLRTRLVFKPVRLPRTVCLRDRGRTAGPWQ